MHCQLGWYQLVLRGCQPTIATIDSNLMAEGTCTIFFLFESRHEKTFCICENKDADQLRGNHEADQRLCFRYMDGTIPLLPKSESSCL